MKIEDGDINPDVVQLEIGLSKLEYLFSKGELSVADMRCLNSASKHHIRDMCLSLCIRNTNLYGVIESENDSPYRNIAKKSIKENVRSSINALQRLFIFYKRIVFN